VAMGKGASKLWKFLFNIYAMAEASNFKGTQRGFAQVYRKIPPMKEVGLALDWGSSPKCVGSPSIFLERLKLAISNLVCSWGLRKSIEKITPTRKVGMAVELNSSLKFVVSL